MFVEFANVLYFVENKTIYYRTVFDLCMFEQYNGMKMVRKGVIRNQ